jgi:hypothetical protein
MYSCSNNLQEALLGELNRISGRSYGLVAEDEAVCALNLMSEDSSFVATWSLQLHAKLSDDEHTYTCDGAVIRECRSPNQSF